MQKLFLEAVTVEGCSVSSVSPNSSLAATKTTQLGLMGLTELTEQGSKETRVLKKVSQHELEHNLGLNRLVLQPRYTGTMCPGNLVAPRGYFRADRLAWF